MAGSGEHIKALVRSHAAGDEQSFYSVAMQVAAQAARQGQHRLARDLKDAIDRSRLAAPSENVTSIARPRGDIADLVTATHPDVALRNLVLPTDLKSQVERILVEQRQRTALLNHGFNPAHRLLLEGPPGTGKTMTASVLARELSLPLVTVRLDALLSKFMGETAGKLRTVFDAVSDQRAVYLFDEFDALGGDRAGNDIGEARRILNSFLIFLEEASPLSLVVAATNHRSILDRALFRRFDMVFTYSLPDSVQATAVMRARLGTMARGIRWPSITAAAQGLSHADLVRAAETAAKTAVLSGADRVSIDDVRAALTSRRTASLD